MPLAYNYFFHTSMTGLFNLILISLILVLQIVTATNLKVELFVTYEQKQAIGQLRRQVAKYVPEKYMKEDLHLLRWLRATRFDVDQAKQGILENIKWRKENNLTNIHLEDFSDLETEFPFTYTLDKQDQPTFIGYAGEWDIRGAVLTGRSHRVLRYMTKLLEQGVRRIRDLQYKGNNITRLNMIIDLGGFNLMQHACVQCLFRIVDFVLIYDDHYPGMADRVIFVNTPPTIAVALEVVRNAANPETWKSIKLYGIDRNVWEKALLVFIDRNKLPEQLGGTMTPEQEKEFMLELFPK